jgi:hypothetical protein
MIDKRLVYRSPYIGRMIYKMTDYRSGNRTATRADGGADYADGGADYEVEAEAAGQRLIEAADKADGQPCAHLVAIRIEARRS